MPVARNRAVIGASLVVLTAVVQIALQGRGDELPLRITELTLVESRDIDRHFVEDTYSARIRHLGPPGSTDFARVAAKIVHPFGLSAPGLVEVVDGELSFGTVRVGEAVESVDTIAIRRLRQLTLKVNQLRWTISARPDLIPSDAWAGRWRFTLTTKDADDGHVVSVSDITDDIGPGEPVGFSIFPPFAHCRWGGSNDSLDATCAIRTRIGACYVEGSASFLLERVQDTATGHGEWHGENTGACGSATGRGGQLMVIAAQRQSPDAEPGPFSIGLLKSFASSEPALFPFIAAAINDTMLDEPSSPRDCLRGGWHRFRHPIFANERRCNAFFQEADRRNQQRGER